jgi:hypothetical protein
MQDIVAQLPEELAIFEKINGHLPDDVNIKPGFICTWNGRYFIHSRATLPLKDIHEGIGFGLWVEVSKTDFDVYLEAENDDSSYEKFKVKGTLANSWPGFENILGITVTVRTISLNEKVYITEVHMDKPRDPLFEVALLAQKDDLKMKKRIKDLVYAYLGEKS